MEAREALGPAHAAERVPSAASRCWTPTAKCSTRPSPSGSGSASSGSTAATSTSTARRIFLSCVPLDNAQVGAATATYEAASESLLRLKSIGINFVYTHNYGCEPGSHLSFAEILRAADDVGMLVSFSQPHFGHYDWKAPDADRSNGYARHAAFYVRVAQNHPSVVFYSMSHNATGYDEDMNPDLIDGLHDRRDQWAANNAKLALRAEAIVQRSDPSRIVYHHASGNLGSMHTSNFYPNFAPIQELSDWFEHWATQGVKPRLPLRIRRARSPGTGPCTAAGTRASESSAAPRCPGSSASPNGTAQFLGDRAFQISEAEKENLRWEAKQFRAGRLWHRWDYPLRHRLARASTTSYAVFADVPDRQLAGLSHLGRLGQFALGIRALLEAARRRRPEAAANCSRSIGRTCSGPDSAPTTSTAATSAWTWPSSGPTGSPRPRPSRSAQQQAAAWPTSPASRRTSRARTTISCPARRSRSSSSSSTTRGETVCVRLPLVVRPAAGRRRGSEDVQRRDGPAGAAFRCTSACPPNWRRARTRLSADA